MAYVGLIPFIVLFTSFVIFRIELVYAAFIALLSCAVVAGASVTALQSTLIFLFEIGLIIFGAFYFIEVAERKGVIDSLANLVREVSSNRIIQALLVCFPLTLMVEGSSGFGTPLLIIAPLLRALGLPLILCATLPMINMVNGIPFGALGTPIRLGIGDQAPILPVGIETVLELIPLFWITPLLSYYLIQKKTGRVETQRKSLWLLWILLLSTSYAFTALTVSLNGVEFPAMAGGLVTFVIGVYTAHFFDKKKLLHPKHRKGLFIYLLLLFTLWLGKKIWMDEKIPGTPIRIFNPGWIFLGFGFFLSRSAESFKPAAIRARKTLAVLFSMTWIVQQLKVSGSMQNLLNVIPLWLTHEGATLIGWLGSSMIGTGTVALLFLSPLVDPSMLGALAAGTAPGVLLAFQSIVGVKSILKEEIQEWEILKIIFPISVGFMTILLLLHVIKPSLD